MKDFGLAIKPGIAKDPIVLSAAIEFLSIKENFHLILFFHFSGFLDAIANIYNELHLLLLKFI